MLESYIDTELTRSLLKSYLKLIQLTVIGCLLKEDIESIKILINGSHCSVQKVLKPKEVRGFICIFDILDVVNYFHQIHLQQILFLV